MPIYFRFRVYSFFRENRLAHDAEAPGNQENIGAAGEMEPPLEDPNAAARIGEVRMEAASDAAMAQAERMGDTDAGMTALIENIHKLANARSRLETEYQSTPTPELARHIIETIDRELLLLNITDQTSLTFDKESYLQSLQHKKQGYESKLGAPKAAVEASDENMLELMKYSAWYKKESKLSGSIPVGDNVENDSTLYNSLHKETHGFLPYLRALIKEVGDGSLFEGSEEQAKEQRLVQRAMECVTQNLQDYSKRLERAKPTDGSGVSAQGYNMAKRLYIHSAQELAEITSGAVVGDQSLAARNGKMAKESAKGAIRYMNIEEAFDWVKSLSRNIDRDNWQSKGVKEAYAELYAGCKEGLFRKLQEMKSAAGNDPEAIKKYREWNVKIAEHFTGRRNPAEDAVGGKVGDTVVALGTFGGSTNSFDADFADTGFAAELAKEAMDYDELAFRYMEQKMKQSPPLKMVLTEERKQNIMSRIPTPLLSDPRLEPMIHMIEGDPATMEEMSAQYATIRNLESIFTGENANIQAELEQYFGAYTEESMAGFQQLLEGGITGSISQEQLTAACGELTQEQIAGWNLLADMEGHG